MLKKAQQLSEDCNMSLAEALNMPLSFEEMYYSSSAWTIRKKAKEDQHIQRTRDFLRMRQSKVLPDGGSIAIEHEAQPDSIIHDQKKES